MEMNDNITNFESGTSGLRNKAIWDRQAIGIFCDLCIIEIEAGHRPGTHFTKLGWENLVVNFSKATGKQYCKQQLKNKWDGLKNDWKLWKQLVGKETGIGWNPQKKTIDATEEWWQQKLKVVPNASKFRKEGIDPELADKYERMYSNTIATGDYAWAPSSGLFPTNEEIFNNNTNLVQTSDDSDDVSQEPIIEANNREKRIKKVKKVNLEKKSAGKLGGAAKLSQQIDQLIETVQRRSKNQDESSNCSITEVMAVVKGLPGMQVGSDLWLFTTRLFLIKEKREMFLTMEEPETMLQWLNYEKTLGL